MTRLLLCFIWLLLISCQTKSKTEVVEAIEATIEKFNPISEVDIIDSPDITILEYLTIHFDRFPDTSFIKKPEWMQHENTKDTICVYIISFKEGHIYKHEQECVEWG